MASSLSIWLAANILAHPRRVRWESADDGSLVYAYRAKGGKEQVIFWVTGDPEQPSSPPLGGADASAALDTFDIRAALMHLLYASYATELQRPWEEAFTLTAQQIANDLGLTQRRDMNQQDKLKLILRLARQPAQLLVHIYWTISGKREAFTVEQSRLWNVKVTYNGQNIASRNENLREIKIHVKPGPWAKYFLNQQGCKEGRFLYQYGYLSSKLLKAMMSCWHNYAGAVRLMIWLLFRSRAGRPALNNVSTLMTIAYGQDALDQARRDRRWRRELAKRWNEDLLVLRENGCPIAFDPDTYPAHLQPAWTTDHSPSQLKRPSKYFDQLLRARCVIRPPADIESALDAITSRKTKRPTPRRRPPRLTKEAIREARLALGWQQAHLARAMGKSRPWVSMIESGKRPVPPQDIERLWQVLRL